MRQAWESLTRDMLYKRDFAIIMAIIGIAEATLLVWALALSYQAATS